MQFTFSLTSPTVETGNLVPHRTLLLMKLLGSSLQLFLSCSILSLKPLWPLCRTQDVSNMPQPLLEWGAQNWAKYSGLASPAWPRISAASYPLPFTHLHFLVSVGVVAGHVAAGSHVQDWMSTRWLPYSNPGCSFYPAKAFCILIQSVRVLPLSEFGLPTGWLHMLLFFLLTQK